MSVRSAKVDPAQLGLDLTAFLPIAPPPPLPVRIVPPQPVIVDEPAAVEPPAADSPPFGTWLVGQVQSRSDWIGGLAKSARADPSFPRRGNPDAVRHYLSQRGADGDMFEAIDDAERAWQRS